MRVKLNNTNRKACNKIFWSAIESTFFENIVLRIFDIESFPNNFAINHIFFCNFNFDLNFYGFLFWHTFSL